MYARPQKAAVRLWGNAEPLVQTPDHFERQRMAAVERLVHAIVVGPHPQWDGRGPVLTNRSGLRTRDLVKLATYPIIWHANLSPLLTKKRRWRLWLLI